jgi:hypothetical protein
MTQRKEQSWNEWDYENRRTPVWGMMLTSAFVSCLVACLDEVGVRPPLAKKTSHIFYTWFTLSADFNSRNACINFHGHEICRVIWLKRQCLMTLRFFTPSKQIPALYLKLQDGGFLPYTSTYLEIRYSKKFCNLTLHISGSGGRRQIY